MQIFTKQKARYNKPKAAQARAATNPQVRNILRAPIQPKLKIGAVNDPAEIEADRVAGQVMRMPVREGSGPESSVSGSSAPDIQTNATGADVQRKCAGCEDDDKIRRKEIPRIRMKASSGGGGGAPASPAAQTAINGLGSGSPLPASERSFFEPRFGRDLSAVRIHTGGTADTASKAINARAFSLGNNIAFANGEYQPGTHTGRTLMAHEITHSLQGGSGVNRVVRRKCDSSSATAYNKKNSTWSKGLLDQLHAVVGAKGDALYTAALKSKTFDANFAKLACMAQEAMGLTGADIDGKIGSTTIDKLAEWAKIIRPSAKSGWKFHAGSGRWEKGHTEFRAQNMTPDQLARGDKPYARINGHDYTQYERGCVGVTNVLSGFSGEDYAKSDCYLTEAEALTKSKKIVCPKGESIKLFAVRYWDTKKATRKVGADGKYPVDQAEVKVPRPTFTNFDYGYRQADGSYVHANHAYLPGRAKADNMKVKISPTFKQYDNGYAGFNTVVYCIRCGKDD